MFCPTSQMSVQLSSVGTAKKSQRCQRRSTLHGVVFEFFVEAALTPPPEMGTPSASRGFSPVAAGTLPGDLEGKRHLHAVEPAPTGWPCPRGACPNDHCGQCRGR